MFNQVFRRKQAIHKQQSQLFKVLLFCGLLFSPVLLLLSPLPGYLIYQGTSNYLSHIVGWFIITLVSLFEIYLFLSVWQKKELLFFKYLFADKFNKTLLVTFFKSSILLHACVWAGYLKADWQVQHLLLSIFIYLYSACVFVLFTKLKLASNTLTSLSFPNVKIVSFLLFKGNFTSILLLVLAAYGSITIINNVEKNDVIFFTAALWLTLNIYMFSQIFKAIRNNKNKLALFLTSINPSYFAGICRLVNILSISMLILLLGVNVIITML